MHLPVRVDFFFLVSLTHNLITTQILRRSPNGCKSLMASTSQTSLLPQMALVSVTRLLLRKLLAVVGGLAVAIHVPQISLLARTK